MTYTQTGRIIKMTGGLYTVRLDAGISDSPLTGQTVECRARGTFRHEQMTPLVGDLEKTLPFAMLTALSNKPSISLRDSYIIDKGSLPIA